MKKYKWQLLISSVVILLPMLFGVLYWDQLPATMVSHWGASGVADGTAPKAFLVFGTPLILLAIQWLLLWISLVLDKNSRQNPKMVRICYSIIPAMSVAIHAMIYAVALEKEWNYFALIPVFVGGLFMFIGNYMPKTTRNRTMGIKISWTLGNDENWNKTHRLGGKIYFWGGLTVLLSALLPIKASVAVLIAMIVVSIVAPLVYSYSIYKKHRKAGIEYEPVFNKKSDKVAIWITAIVVPLILVGVGIVMFTGNMKVTYGDTDFQVKATYSETLTVRYDEVESVEYLDSVSFGLREFGFNSARLCTGTFNNAEFGRYTLYAYTQGEGAVVLKKEGKVLVIVGATAEETMAIYETLAAKVQ